MPRKRLNKRLVISLSLAAFSTIVILAVLMLHQLQSTDPRRFADLAARYEGMGEWKQAALFYHKAWERSKDWSYIVAKGDMLLKDGEVPPALQSWQEALIKQPDLMEAHVKLVGLLLEFAGLDGRVEGWIRVHEAAETMLEVATNPVDQAFAHHANGLALLNSTSQAAENAELGLDALRRAVELDPQIVEYAIDLAQQYIDREDYDQAEGLYSELLERHPDPGPSSAAVRGAYARYLFRRQRFAEADRQYQQGVTLAQHDPEAYLDARSKYAEFLTQRWASAVVEEVDAAETTRQFERLEALLKECIQSNPDAFEPYLQLAIAYKAAKRHQDVADLCDLRLQRGFSRKGLDAARHRIYAFRLMILAAEACVAHVVAEDDAVDPSRRDEWLSRARQYLDDANAEVPNHPQVFSQSGRIKLAWGRERDALEDFRKAEEAYRASGILDWPNKLSLARLHLRLNEPGAARTVLEEVLEQAEGRAPTSYWILYANALLTSAEAGAEIDERTEQRIDQVLATISLRDPDNVQLRQLRAAFLERLGKHREAAPLADSPAVTALLEARERAQDGDMEGALRVLRMALEGDPADPRLVGSTVGELLRLDRTGEARDIVERALAVDPNSTLLQKLAVLSRDSLSPSERDEALLKVIEGQNDAYQRSWDLIDFYWRRGDFATALRHFDEAERHLIDQDTPMARRAKEAQHRALLKAKLYVAAKAGDESALAAARDSAARYNIDGADGKSVLGLYHMYREEWDLAILALIDAVKTQPTDARSLTHLGQCLQRVGRPDEARTYLERALRINPNEGLAHKSLAIDAANREEEESFAYHLERCATLLPADPWVENQLLLRQEQQEPEQAIKRRETRLADQPDDPDNLLRLAVLYEKVDRLDQGDRCYERLLALRGDDQNLIAAVAKYYRRTDRPDRALALLNRHVESLAPGLEKSNARILVAAHQLSQHQLDLVESTLLSAVDETETFALCHSLGDFYLRQIKRPREALRWYDRAVALYKDEDPSGLSAVLAARVACLLDRTVNDLDAAEKVVEDFRARFPNDPQGFLWESEILARRGKIESAADALTRFLMKMPDNPRARYQRAQYYAALGRTAAAIEDLESVKRVDPTAMEMEPRRALAGLYLQAGRKGDWIAELESIAEAAPDSPRAVEELIAAYASEKRLAEADRLITAQINRTHANPEARWFFLRGRVSMELGNIDRALRDYRRGAEVGDFSAASLATVLEAYLRMGRPADGAAYYQEHASDTNRTPETLARYARLLFSADRAREAVDVFREAAALALSRADGSIGTVTRELGAAFSEQTAAEAIAGFENDVPDGPLGRANDHILARLYRLAGRVSEAIALLERLIQTASEDSARESLYTELGELHQQSGNARDAVRAYEQAIEYNPDNWIALNNVAYVRSDELGEYALALPYAKRAVAIADIAATLDTLGWIYAGLGEHASAIAELSRAVRLSPTDPLCHYHLGEAYRRNQQFIEATGMLRQAMDLADQARNPVLRQDIETSLEKAGRRDST